ncbi:GTPase HflX [Oceanobacillus sp. J11TS1]|uniref:GTPase HflX n=1 Tax=Oceanobacillus sp. J11TS1 TaxID=2807191 RepID=UPI001B21EF49|nr:GTPase HflX [Oceanobacillus sp. J11TS1]GIO21846.1 GTPase HflX [Oceanobacillus sp. J11TS1]
MTVEKVLVIAVNQSKKSERQFQSSLDELVSLCKTAGGLVHHVITQNRDRIHPATYIGEGKLQEVKQIVDGEEMDLVVANNELSAGQIRNLADALGVRVLDRSQLILDIFAMRAQTKEGKLQVELAQLEYLLPRLHGQGANLSRLGGGIGTRGPGETKLETDRRHIERRIYDIKRRFQLVVKQRDQYRKRRRANDIFQIAIVGYTNAGKSTIFNRLTNSQSLEEDQLFATLDPLTRRIQLPSGLNSLITDTVGFIQDLPTALIAAFKSTLEEVAEADFLLHVVDVSDPDLLQQQETVRKLLTELDAAHIPVLTVYNKKDQLEADFFLANQFPNVQISAWEEADLQTLLMKIEEVLKEEWDFFDIVLDINEGDLLYQLQSSTLVVKKDLIEEMNQYHVQGYVRKDHPFHRFVEEK